MKSLKVGKSLDAVSTWALYILLEPIVLLARLLAHGFVKLYEGVLWLQTSVLDSYAETYPEDVE